MSLTDTFVTSGEKKLDELQKKVVDTIEYYNNLLQTATPSSILHVSDGAEKATELLVPKLPESVFKKWNTRATSIEKVNSILVQFETDVAKAMTSSSAGIVLKEVHKLYKKFAWIVTHIGTITLLAAEGLGLATGLYGDQIKQGLSNAVSSIFSGDWGKVLDGLTESKDAIQKALSYASQSVTFGLLAAILEGTVTAFTSSYYVRAIQPILDAKKKAEDALMKAAFPQSAKRTRAVKHSKRN